MLIHALYALDDSCQQQLYARGHVDLSAFIEACRDYAPHATIWADAGVRHCWIRWRPIRGNIVSDTAADILESGQPGATPVTLLEPWLPIHAPAHHPDCDVNDLNPDGIRKACNCAGRDEHGLPQECEESVISKIRLRRNAGRRKYGTSMERTDLTRRQWLQHAQEEAMDLAIYLERLMREEPPHN